MAVCPHGKTAQLEFGDMGYLIKPADQACEFHLTAPPQPPLSPELKMSERQIRRETKRAAKKAAREGWRPPWLSS